MSWLQALSAGCCGWWQICLATLVGLLLVVKVLYPAGLEGGLLGTPEQLNAKKQREILKRAEEEEEECKMVLCVRNDLGMGKGKIAAQCCHAALGAYRRAREAITAVEAERRMGGIPGGTNPKMEAHRRIAKWLERWEEGGEAKIVVKLPDAEAGMDIVKAAMMQDLNAYCVHDAGRTQVPRGSMTAVAVGPAPASRVDNVTGHLKLL